MAGPRIETDPTSATAPESELNGRKKTAKKSLTLNDRSAFLRP
jgi:hypothetical protein